MELVGQEDQNFIAKGKRTKRQKFQMLISPNPNFSEPNFELVGQCHSFFNFSSSSSSDGRDVEDNDNDNEYKDEDEDMDEDDKDMANCLILLAQGSPASSQPFSSLGKFMGEDQNGARKPASIGAGKSAGRCVYKCKTCSRTFPSFQALGGHRSSHKNSAIAAAVCQNPIAVIPPANEHQRKQFNNNNISSPFDRLHLSRSDYDKNKFKLVSNNNKVHQCSICGAKFMSGQALGGHMRRHRRVYGEAFEDSGEIERRRLKKQRSNLLCLDLDLNLNLPAPEDDVKDRSGAVLMAAPPLLGCNTENIEHFCIWM